MEIRQERYLVRIASEADIPLLGPVAISATKKFGTIPALASLQEDEKMLPVKIEKWLKDGRVYVVEDDDKMIGFISARRADDIWFVEELSVHLDHQGKGVGGRLLDEVFQLSRDNLPEESNGVARVSLTTYADVPWNGPWYRNRGFKEVTPETIGPWHEWKMKYDKEERELEWSGYRRCLLLWEHREVRERPNTGL